MQILDELLRAGLLDDDLDKAESLIQKRRKELQKEERVLIGFVLDKSSSMGTVAGPTVSGFNEWLAEAKRTMPNALLTLTLFNTTYETRYENEPIKNVQPLTSFTYQPNGMTALYDAVADTIHRLKREVRNGEFDKALVIIQTDGEENSSRRFTFEALKGLVDEANSDPRWTIVALGAEIDAWATFSGWGLAKGNTLSYTYDSTPTTFRGLANSTAVYAAAPAGGGPITDFFDPSGADDGGGNDDANAGASPRPAGTGG